MERVYPLQWPQGVPRTPHHRVTHSRFDVTPNRAQMHMRQEIERLGGRNIVVSTNQRVRQDGGIYAADLNKTPDDAGVAVYFDRKGQRVCFACDRFYRLWENMRAIGKTIEAMRAIERYGSKEMLDQAFTGFTALPSPEQAAESRPWWTVLGVSPNASTSEIRTAWRGKANQVHPDHGGSDQLMAEVNAARDAGLKARGQG